MYFKDYPVIGFLKGRMYYTNRYCFVVNIMSVRVKQNELSKQEGKWIVMVLDLKNK